MQLLVKSIIVVTLKSLRTTLRKRYLNLIELLQAETIGALCIRHFRRATETL